MPIVSQPLPPRVLVATGLRYTRRRLREGLSKRGYRAFGVERCDAARRLLRTGRFDAFIGEVSMPDECGLSLLKYAMHDAGVMAVAMVTRAEWVDFDRTEVQAFHGVLHLSPLNWKEFVAMLSAILTSRTCPDCKGFGKISLLFSRVSCTKCCGTGRFRHTPSTLS